VRVIFDGVLYSKFYGIFSLQQYVLILTFVTSLKFVIILLLWFELTVALTISWSSVECSSSRAAIYYS